MSFATVVKAKAWTVRQEPFWGTWQVLVRQDLYVYVHLYHGTSMCLLSGASLILSEASSLLPQGHSYFFLNLALVFLHDTLIMPIF